MGGIPPSTNAGTRTRDCVVRFGSFELDLRAGELCKKGLKIKLHGQPLDVLALLLEQPGQVVTREELQEKLWASDTFVDFEHGLNKAINKLREALNDNADHPRFVETLPRRGYRFIGTINATETPGTRAEVITGAAPSVDTDFARGTLATVIEAVMEQHRAKRRWVIATAGLVLVVLAALTLTFGKNLGDVRERLFGRDTSLRIQSLAVLPLENLSSDSTQEYFSDGMTDALITNLAQMSSLKVISRTSAMRYKQTKKALPEIARELNVDGIVEGTVQRSGDQVRVDVQLVHGPSDKHIWAHSYERDLRDTLELQEAIARDVTEGISASLAKFSSSPLASAHALNANAYDDYLKGRSLVRQQRVDKVVEGIELLEQSIQRDPNYAPAYAELSFATWQLASFGHRAPMEVLPGAKVAALKALALDDNLADAHAMLGVVHGQFEWDWAGEERELKRALDVDPNSATAHALYSVHLVTLGQKTDAVREINTALELDPFSPVQHVNASFVARLTHQKEEALRHARRAVEIDPNSASGHSNLASALWGEGLYDQAFGEWLQYLRRDGYGDLAQQLTSAKAKLSDPGDPGQKLAHLTLDYYRKKSKTEYVAALNIAGEYLDLGDKETAFLWFNKAYEERSPGLYAIAVEPYCDPLRSDPRFQDLLRRMNLRADPPPASKN